MSIPVMPEKVVLDQMLTRLSHNVDGLNATFNSLAATFLLEPALATLAIDFASAPSKNFILGDVDPGDFEQTSAFRYPIVTLAAKRSGNNNLQKFTTFSGLVTVGLNAYISWKNNNARRDFESYGNCFSAAIYTIINRSRSGSFVDQNWSAEVTFNGDIALVKSGVKRDADNWFQQLAFTLAFEVDQ